MPTPIQLPELTCRGCRQTKPSILFSEAERSKKSPQCCACDRQERERRKPPVSQRGQRWDQRSMIPFFQRRRI